MVYKGGHDISHCSGEICPLKKTCVRYIAHLQMKDYLWPVSYIKPPYDFEKKKCNMYWKMKNVGSSIK